MKQLFASLLLVVTVAGCQRVNTERAWQMEQGDIKSISVDAPRSEQKVLVAVNSASAPVDVYIVLDGDADAATEALQADRKPAKALAAQEKVQDVLLDATVPAGKSYKVLVRNNGGKNSDVKVKVTGK